MFKVSNKNTKKKCEICPGGNYSEKNVWGRILWKETFIWRGLFSREELIRGNCLEMKSRGNNYLGRVS